MTSPEFNLMDTQLLETGSVFKVSPGLDKTWGGSSLRLLFNVAVFDAKYPILEALGLWSHRSWLTGFVGCSGRTDEP